MNSYYKNAITVFGIALPLIGFAVIAGGALYAVTTINKKHSLKEVAFSKSQKEEKQLAHLQGMVAKNGKHLQIWNTNLDTETRGTFLEHWKEAEKKFTGKEFSRSPHNWVNYSEGLGKGIKQPASQVEMKFSGTYRAMQLALMEIESKLPQLQLDALSMTPDNNAGTLNFSTTFTVWTKN